MAMGKVCIIEDDDSIREIVRDLLQDAGYVVIVATNGLEGKHLLETVTERLIVILDYRLPALDGCDLLESVERDERLRERHTYIMMSASPQKTVEDCGEAIENLAAPVIAKPFDIDELVEAVHEAGRRLEPGSEADREPAQTGD